MTDVRKLAEDWIASKALGKVFYPDFGEHKSYLFNGILVPKERPRKGAGGHMYTPTRTREFEAKIAAWGREKFQAPANYPVSIRISLFDKTADAFLLDASNHGLVYDEHGDLDNYEKSICDALNGIAWIDDRRIVRKSTVRVYAEVAGFQLTVAQCGLAKHEVVTLRNLMRMHQK